jgi:hypothetical protein
VDGGVGLVYAVNRKLFSLGGGFYAMRNGWTYLVAGVTVLVYIVYIAMAVWTFYNLPPIS